MYADRGYVELYYRYSSAAEDQKEQAKNELVTYIWRIRETMMIHAYTLWVRLVGNEEATADDSPLKSDEPVTEKELLDFLQQVWQDR